MGRARHRVRGGVAAGALLFVLVTTAGPAHAASALPLAGTFAAEDFNEDCSQFPVCEIVVQHDTNLGPAVQSLEIVIALGNGTLTWDGIAVWEFEDGTLQTAQAGSFSFQSGMTAITDTILGGTGRYAGAAGRIHISQFGFRENEAFEPLAGFLYGSIVLP